MFVEQVTQNADKFLDIHINNVKYKNDVLVIVNNINTYYKIQISVVALRFSTLFRDHEIINVFA